MVDNKSDRFHLDANQVRRSGFDLPLGSTMRYYAPNATSSGPNGPPAATYNDLRVVDEQFFRISFEAQRPVAVA